MSGSSTEQLAKEKCLHEMFIEQAEKTHDKMAVIANDKRSITFGELNRQTEILSTYLRHVGCKKGAAIGIYMDRQFEYPLAYIAALRAGCAYFPVEITYPAPLLKSVLEDANPPAVITIPFYYETLKKVTGATMTVVCLDDSWIERLEKENANRDPLPPVVSFLDDLAYIIYSSGTTGKPKGIKCPHRGAVFSYGWRHDHYPFSPDDRVACNVFFPWEMLRPLLKGIPLYIIPDDMIYDPKWLVKFLQENQITRILFTPSLLEAVLADTTIEFAKSLPKLKIVWLCGEVVTMQLRSRFIELLPNVQLLNLYSVSECHDVCVADLSAGKLEEELQKQGKTKGKFCPVGKVFEGVYVMILDAEMNPLPIGMSGEIYVGGPTLALGYVNKPELTATKFVKRPPKVPQKVGPRLYRTGDWGYMLSNGELEICGRCDSMVKVRGYSVELQAIEAALLDLEMVSACTVLAHGEEGTDKYIVAYIVPTEGVTKKKIRDALKARLPFHMIPSYFVLLNSIPVTNMGKLDKKLLPAFNRDQEAAYTEDEPITLLEKQISEIWKQVLQLKVIDKRENFFDLGGHSLLAARMLASVREKWNIDIAMADLFKNNTIADFAGVVGRRTANNSDSRSDDEQKQVNLFHEVEYHDLNFINMDMLLRAFWRFCQYEHRWYSGRVLLTGATGYLGAFLLRDLLLTTKVHVYCLVRELPGQGAMQRLQANLKRFGILAGDGEAPSEEQSAIAKTVTERVTALRGDVGLLNLGLSEEEFMYLTHEIDFVIHAAAVVNLIYPYQALHGPNVMGTRNILMFASANKVKPVHYISTNAVFPHGLTNCAEDADMKSCWKDLEDGYSQTKWVAEQLVTEAGRRGLPVAIYRLGNLAGETDSAFWNPSDFNFLILLGCIETAAAPNVEWKIEMTPVNFVSSFIVKLTQDIFGSLGKTFHVVSTKLVDSKRVFEFISTHGYPLDIISYDEWVKRIEANHAKNPTNPSKLLLHLLNNMVGSATFFENLSTYDTSEYGKVLDALKMPYPTVNGVLLTNYLKCLADRKILPPPKFHKSRDRPLSGKVAIVTGASSGIGEGIARKLAESGASVAMAARRIDKLEVVRNSLLKDGNVSIAIKTDVVNRDECVSMVQITEEALGPVDIIVNCAGVMYFTLMKNMHVEEWERQIDVNCKGVVNGVAAVLPGMMERGAGHVINISSDAGRKVFPGLAVYSATKFFVEAFSQGLRLEMADSGIKVTTIQPGDVKSELVGHTTDIEAKEIYDNPSGVEVLVPEDIANAVLYAVNQPRYCAVNEILIEPRQAPC